MRPHHAPRDVLEFTNELLQPRYGWRPRCGAEEPGRVGGCGGHPEDSAGTQRTPTKTMTLPAGDINPDRVITGGAARTACPRRRLPGPPGSLHRPYPPAMRPLLLRR